MEKSVKVKKDGVVRALIQCSHSVSQSDANHIDAAMNHLNAVADASATYLTVSDDDILMTTEESSPDTIPSED